MVIFTGSMFKNSKYGSKIEDRCWKMASKMMPFSIFYPPSSYSMGHRAPFLCDVRFKFAAKLAYECARRPGGGITEGADRVARDVARDVENQIQITLFALAIFDPVQNLLHPVAAFAAWAALAAGLVREESGKVQRRPHHAGGFIHNDHAARAEQASRRLDRFIVQINFFDFLGPQHGHGSATGNHAFEFFAARHATAILFKKLFERITHFQLVDAGLGDMTADAEELRPLAFLCANGGISRRGALNDPRQSGQRLDIVHHRRTTEKAMGRRKRRLQFRPAAA